MLKLKRLQILGFKSFCDRTELRFHGDGVAAIVGPNGCGKSNIADSICWVLGEQSAKSLRGSRMEDVIFGGTSSRKPTGMAEVSLTLVDPEVYEGTVTEAEIEICDEMPEQDWDEESLRATAEEETQAYADEVQPGKAPGKTEEANGPLPPGASAPESTAEGAAQAAPSGTSAVSAEAVAAAANPHHVVLKIRRRKFKPLPLRKGEIVVTRRLFRSGDSEYLLNHKLCRLRDIQDIFMGTGLGPESYAIIEQGRIGQILSSKPTDRRNIIEEAAGITKFKTKKRLAEARLEDSKLNLNRVNDIFEEVTRQMNSLKRQAAKAARYVRLRDEMRDKLRVVLASKFAWLQEETHQHQQELAAIADEIRQKTDEVRQWQDENGQLQQRGYAVENAARENRDELNRTARELDRGTARQKQNQERLSELDQRTAAAQQELSQTAAKLDELQAERAGNREILDSAETEAAAAAQQLAARQQDTAAATQALAAIERQQESRRVAILEAANQAASIRNRITQAEEHAAALGRETQRLTGEISTAELQLEGFGGERGQLQLEFQGAAERLEALGAEIRGARQKLAEKGTAERESKLRLDGLRAEYASALGKRSSLEAVIAEHGYSTDSVRRLFKSGALNHGFAPAGVLADFLEVDDRYEHVVEDFLREELNYVVVKSWDAADAGLNLLRTDVDGRATFLVHPNDSQAKFPFDPPPQPAQIRLAGDPGDEARQSAPPRDHLLPLKNTIRVLNGFGRSLEVILPKLRDGYIVSDPAIGREMALEHPDAFFLAQSGECFHNVTVTGGKQTVEGPLSRKRELREVMKLVADLERGLREEETKVQTLGREIGEFTSLLERLEADKREAEKIAMTSGHTLRQLDAEMARVRQRLDTYGRELQRVGAEQSAKEALIAEKQTEAEPVEERREQLELAMKAAQAEQAALEATRDTASQNASEARAAAATLEERRRAAAQTLQRMESLVAEVRSRVNTLESQIGGAETEKQQRAAENARIAEQLVELAAAQQDGAQRELELTAQAEQVRARLAEIEQQLQTAREALDKARDRRGEVAAVLAKLESDATHMAESCQYDLGITAEQLRADPTLTALAGEPLAAAEAAQRELRSRLEAMGPVNLMALDEFNEVEKRHEFLETQRQDLLDSIANTQETIREIEAISREKFNEAFARINENFQVAFRKLFGGGSAFMRLTDEQNSAESGIDVVVSPPGKKLQNVLLLSGGEKALTALALLVGVFQYQPSPFCILDEVDAPLDDANVGRFTELVRELSLHTQFVLITHQKKTMSIAPVMYGVTMQEPGISKLVSVRFGEPAAPAVN